MGSWWGPRTRGNRKGQTFAAENPTLDVLLTLSFGHRTSILWLTWSDETRECPCAFCPSSFVFLSDSGDLELKSVQRSRRFPVQMETEHYQPGHRGESPTTLGPVRDLLIMTFLYSSYKIPITT